jgi:hypothetical protein
MSYGGVMVEINGQDLVEETRSRVLVVTEQKEFSGYIHRVNSNQRETDVLNDDKPFIHLTQVEIRTRERQPQKVPFVAVNKSSIICVIPEEDG